MVSMRISCVAMAVVLTLCLTASSQAVNLLVNGDFEDTTGWGDVGTFQTPDGWYSGGDSTRKNPADIQQGTAAIGGMGTSAYMPGYKTSVEAERGQMAQWLGGTDAEWNLSLDFASTDPGSTSERSLHMVLYPETAPYMIFRVVGGSTAGMGSVEFYTGNVAGWYQIPGLENVITFSDDIQNNPLSHNLEITGHFDQATPTWDISLTDPSGTVTSATDLVYWCDGVSPSQGEGLNSLYFQTFVSAGDTVIDNVSVSDTSGEYIINGDFEDTNGWGAVGTSDRPEGWVGDAYGSKNAAAIQDGTAAIGGSGTSAYLPYYPTSIAAERRVISQTLDEPTGLDWSFEFDAAAVDTDDPAQRNLHFVLALDGEAGSSLMIFKVLGSSTSDSGALQIYDQNTSTYSTISGFEDCFVFSDDVTVDALVNHLSIDAHFDSETPTWDISLTDPSGNVTSATGIEFTQGLNGVGGLSEVEFQTFLSYGDALVDNLVVTDNSALLPGDANGDGKVDGSDVTILAGNWQAGVGDPNPETITWEMGDFNGDGQVDGSDVTILAGNWQAGVNPESAAVPEPSTVALLIAFFASLAMGRVVRRK